MRAGVWKGFLTLEAMLYLSFLTMDMIPLGDTAVPKYLSIFLVALMGVLFVKERRITIALCLTAAADVFLLLLGKYYTVGICLFFCVQLCYALVLDGGKGLPIRLLLSAAVGICAVRVGVLEGIAAGYLTLFFCNLLRAGAAVKRNPLFFLGLLLFFCCDLCVGYYNIGSGPMWEFCRIAMWGFYLPGQILILYSFLWKEKSRHEA